MYTQFQCPTMPGTGLKVCVVWAWCGGCAVACKPIIVFRLAQAEQFQYIFFDEGKGNLKFFKSL